MSDSPPPTNPPPESTPPPSPTTVLNWTLLVEGGAGLLALAVGIWLGSSPWKFIVWNLSGLAWGLLASLPALAILLLTVRFPIGPLADLKQLVLKVIGEFFARCTWLEFALIATAAGFGEELLFRGLIQHFAVERYGLITGLAIASLLFGLGHAMSKTYFVLATIVGFYLGWLWWWTGNLLAPIVTHAVYDFVALVYLQRLAARDDEPEEE